MPQTILQECDEKTIIKKKKYTSEKVENDQMLSEKKSFFWQLQRVECRLVQSPTISRTEL